MSEIRESYDVAVIGGGMAGICAAVAAARGGAMTVLVQDRPVLGGNASSEIRVHINGCQDLTGPNWIDRETGIIEEILVENRARNPQESWPLFDHILYEFVTGTENLTLHLNTSAREAETDGDRIVAARCCQPSTERDIVIEAKLFVDCSGDGTLAVSAGAEFRIGREGADEFDESYATKKPDGWTMGSSLTFEAVDTGASAPYIPPAFVKKLPSCDDIPKRWHGTLDHGYWWIEIGADEDHVAQGEEVHRKLMAYIHGVWDHLKNSGEHPEAENWALSWVGSVPGRRESRRFMGDHILTQTDLTEHREFPDAVAYGGWSIDEHCPGGIESPHHPPTWFHENFERGYQIPFRCLYSKNVQNLLFAGRNISCSHIAMSSTRVMGTCATMGIAAGAAAAMCASSDLTPRELGESRIAELQENLLRQDAYIPRRPAADTDDIAREAKLSASSTAGGDVALLTDGVSRDEEGSCHHWESDGLPASVELEWSSPQAISSVEIKLDSNVNRPICLSRDSGLHKRMVPGVPPELVSDLFVEVAEGDKWREVARIEASRKRLVKLALDGVGTSKIRVTFEATHGHENARVFEVRCYG